VVSNVRQFNGSSDYLEVGSGVTDSAYGTQIAILKKTSDPTSNGCFFDRRGGSSVLDENMIVRSNHPSDANQLAYVGASGTAVFSSFTVTNADGWVILGVSKATGTATPRMHKCVLSSVTWTHQNASGSVGNPTAASGWRFGSTKSGSSTYADFFAGNILLVAYWDASSLSDGTVAGFSSLATILAASPTGLWLLNQSSTGTSVTEYNGTGANQTAISGTTVVSDTIPNFTLTSAISQPGFRYAFR